MPLTKKQFVEKYYPEVINLTKGTGLFPQVMMAQMILESAGKVGNYYYPGESVLSKKYNNYFGIKADKSWAGKKVNIKTGEVYNGQSTVITDAFRVYENPQDSMKDYVSFLKKNPRYEKAGVFKAKNPKEQAELLKKAGYATAPDYPEKIMQLIKGISTYLDRAANFVSDNLKPIIMLSFALLFILMFKHGKNT
jgi:flagellum-specific peptidoglycan hydrolase FlgJ